MKINLGSIESLDQNFKLNAWIGVDLDGTLAHYDEFKGWNVIGDPIPDMIKQIKEWRSKGITVKILTARASEASCKLSNITRDQIEDVIHAWCQKHIGEKLPVTSEKDHFMIFSCDDSVVQIIKNKGIPISKDGYTVFNDVLQKLTVKEEKDGKENS